MDIQASKTTRGSTFEGFPYLVRQHCGPLENGTRAVIAVEVEYGTPHGQHRISGALRADGLLDVVHRNSWDGRVSESRREMSVDDFEVPPAIEGGKRESEEWSYEQTDEQLPA